MTSVAVPGKDLGALLRVGSGPEPPFSTGKVIGVHLNYRSRAEERGRVPRHASYFLKPPSTLSLGGGAVLRPPGCELLAFEGEVALVLGRRALRVEPAEAFSYVAAVTAANDFGVYDFRWPDSGSHVRAKGVDGFTPIGPSFLEAAGLDWRSVRLRTWVNGELRQDADMKELLFGFDELIADLSRLMTLEPGDVILTGTPTGATVVEPGDLVEVEVSAGGETTGRLASRIGEGDYVVEPLGAMPKVDAAVRAAAYGAAGERRAAIADEAALTALARVSTATLSSQLRRRGLEGCTMDGLRPARSGARLVGLAKTLRYLPLREDLFAERGGGMNAQKRGIEEIRPGEVLVIEARGERNAGTVGDILALRAAQRGARGVVTDGAIRDSATLGALEIPIYHAATHPAVLGRRHVPWETDVAIACAGVLVQPGDVVVGDDDGVVVLPPKLVAEVLADAEEQERQERFIAAQVRKGASIAGLYPLGPDWRDAYEKWCRQEGEE